MIDTAPSEEIWLQGRAVVPGLAIGSLYLLPEISASFSEKNESGPICIDRELRRFSVAVSESQAELRFLFEKLKNEGFCQEADIVGMHLELTADPELCHEVEKGIRQSGRRADSVLAEVIEKYRCRFEKIPVALIRQRFEDVESVCFRILSFLTVSPEKSRLDIPPQAILFAKTVTATIAAEVSVNGVGAIVTTHGGAMSHTAIVAKARGIPYVTDIQGESLRDAFSGTSVIVDGLAGLVILRPTDETIRRYMTLKESHESYFRRSSAKIHCGGYTKDGMRISLMANVSGIQEVRQLQAFGMDGVGLYRTEYQVLERRRFPTEQEQSDVYAEMVRAAEDRPVVIRSFDFGSDKGWEGVGEALPGFEQGKRTIDLLLGQPQIFLAHLRAIIRASSYGSLSILFPMIASVDELDKCLHLYSQAKAMVESERGVAIGSVPQPGIASKGIKIGVMVELPALAFHTSSLAGKVDFLSIGTNDLIQYSLAVDRSNSASYDPRLSYHPGLLRLLRFIVQESEAVKLPLCLCGEMASDPLLIPFLIGIGIHELSIAPRLAPMVKHVLRAFSVDQAKQITHSVLSCNSAQETYAFLRTQYCTIPGD